MSHGPRPDVSHLIEYNNEALDAGTEDNVLLFVTVEENGRARGDALSGLAHGLTQNAVEAIEGARHEPATFMGGNASRPQFSPGPPSRAR